MGIYEPTVDNMKYNNPVYVYSSLNAFQSLVHVPFDILESREIDIWQGNVWTPIANRVYLDLQCSGNIRTI